MLQCDQELTSSRSIVSAVNPKPHCPKVQRSTIENVVLEPSLDRSRTGVSEKKRSVILDNFSQ